MCLAFTPNYVKVTLVPYHSIIANKRGRSGVSEVEEKVSRDELGRGVRTPGWVAIPPSHLVWKVWSNFT